jgi:transposase-like protein
VTKAKLTDKQRKQIIAEYVEGGTSHRALAKKYGVAATTIANLLRAHKDDVVQKCAEVKKENTLSMIQYLENKRVIAQEIIGDILQSTKEEIAQASVRDKMGALKIISDIFLNNITSPIGDNGIKIDVHFADFSAKGDDNASR